MKEINKPKELTYFICREDETNTITAYGEINPDQVMKTGQPIVETYSDKDEWEAKLLEGGITLDEYDLTGGYNFEDEYDFLYSDITLDQYEQQGES